MSENNKNKKYNICEHNKRISRCKECGGSALCEHDIEKYKCIDCGGSKNICEHNIRKYFCIPCKGKGICEHTKRKWQCLDCKGTSYCEHNKRKASCKECGGTQICEHNIDKRYCKDCDGSMFCKHDKNKYRCKECDGRSLCKSEWCTVRAIPKYNNYCLSCCIQVCPDIKVTNNYKTKEKDVVDRIKQEFPDFDWVHDKKINGGCSNRRPDLLLDLLTHVIIVEIDENAHTDYDTICENKRLMELSQDLGFRPIIFIRFNPDEYCNDDGILIKSCWRINNLGIMQLVKKRQEEWIARIDILKEKINFSINNPSEKMINIIQLFY
jgi:hypothetical protein